MNKWCSRCFLFEDNKCFLAEDSLRCKSNDYAFFEKKDLDEEEKYSKKELEMLHGSGNIETNM